jgi:hypothetical protein
MQALDWQDKSAQENEMYKLFSLYGIWLCPFRNGAFFVWLTSIHDDLQGESAEVFLGQELWSAS